MGAGNSDFLPATCMSSPFARLTWRLACHVSRCSLSK